MDITEQADDGVEVVGKSSNDRGAQSTSYGHGVAADQYSGTIGRLGGAGTELSIREPRGQRQTGSGTGDQEWTAVSVVD